LVFHHLVSRSWVCPEHVAAQRVGGGSFGADFPALWAVAGVVARESPGGHGTPHGVHGGGQPNALMPRDDQPRGTAAFGTFAMSFRRFGRTLPDATDGVNG